MLEHLDRTDLDALRAAAERLVGLCIVEVDAGDEDDVAAFYIEAALPSKVARMVDGRIVEPEAGAWRVEEIDSLIIAPAQLAPSVCNVIVVKSADAMTQAGIDRLLKTIEEPAARTSFCFLVRDRGELGSTVLGRAGTVLVAQSSDSWTSQQLATRGVPASLLEQYGPSWGSSLGLLVSLESAEAVCALLAGCDTWRSPAPRAEVAALVEVLDGLGKDPVSKRRGRMLCGALLAAMGRSVRASLRSGESTPGVALVRLASLEAARENLAYNGSLPLVLNRAVCT